MGGWIRVEVKDACVHTKTMCEMQYKRYQRLWYAYEVEITYDTFHGTLDTRALSWENDGYATTMMAMTTRQQDNNIRTYSESAKDAVGDEPEGRCGCTKCTQP